jgi:peptidoglycan endopeptidase LytE
VGVTPSPVPPTPASYRVVSGDTLSGLAARWDTTVKEIMELNGLTTTLIRVGQVLLIPSPIEAPSEDPGSPSSTPVQSAPIPG